MPSGSDIVYSYKFLWSGKYMKNFTFLNFLRHLLDLWNHDEYLDINFYLEKMFLFQDSIDLK